MLLVLLVGTLLLWSCGAVLVTAVCWAAGRGDGQVVVLPDAWDERPAVADPTLASA